jgi:thiol-disulfide isomerase/thioredoxin
MFAVHGIQVVLATFAWFGCSSRSESHDDHAVRAAPPHDAAPSRTTSVGDAASAPAATPPDVNRALDAELAWYRVVATVADSGDVPFAVGVHRERPEGWIASGTERLPLVVVKRSPLVLRIPVRGAELRFEPAGADGRLRGQWVIKYFFKQDFDIVAEPIAGPAPELVFPGDEPPAVDISGAWRIDIKDFGVGRAMFRQDARGALAGTIIPPDIGDLRYLMGRVTGSHAQLTAFDGIHCFLIELTAADGGKQLTGHWLIAGAADFSFTATREDAPATHVAVSAHMAPGKSRITLSGLDRAPYKGKPVIVEYFGSWCPVCLDLMPELARLEREHAAAGLQVRSIALEPPGDKVETRRRLDEFRTAFGITWPFEVRYTDDFYHAAPPEVLDAAGFPVTIFLRRDHTVAGVHTGFISRAAGPEHDAVVKRFDELVAEIVASPPVKSP